MAFIKSDMRLVRMLLISSILVMLIFGWENVIYAVELDGACSPEGLCDCAGTTKVQCTFIEKWKSCDTTGECDTEQCVAVNCSGATTTTVAATTTTVAGPTTTTTTVVSAPTVETDSYDPLLLTETESRLVGKIVSDGGSAITDKGFCWSTSANPTIADAHASGTGNPPFFRYTVSGLTPGTTYHFRAYATNGVGTSYGVDKTFTTLSPTTTTTTSTTTTTVAPTTTSTSTTTTLAPTTTTTTVPVSTTTTTVAGVSTTTTLPSGSTTTTIAGASTTTTLSGGSTTTTVASGSTTTSVPSGSTTTTIPGSSTTTSVPVSTTTTTTTTTTSTTTTTLPGTPQAGRNGDVSTLLNDSFMFQITDFIVTGDNGQNFGGIKIVSPETAGDLEYNGADVAAETECADVSKLIFTPEQGKKGYPYATFTFKVKDKTKGTFSATYTMTVNVVIPGDVDHNGKVTIGDVLRAFIDILDGKATLRDVLRALFILVGKEPELII